MRNIRFQKKKESDQEQEQQLQIVNFIISKEQFGADILGIKQIYLYEAYSKVPDAPDFIEGFVIIRNQVVPIIDLCKRFFGTPSNIDLQTRIIVAIVAGNMVGFIVDSVSRVMTIAKKCITPPPRIMTKIDTDYMQGVAVVDEQKILLVDFDKILTKSKKRELLNMLNDEERKELAHLLSQEEQS